MFYIKLNLVTKIQLHNNQRALQNLSGRKWSPRREREPENRMDLKSWTRGRLLTVVGLSIDETDAFDANRVTRIKMEKCKVHARKQSDPLVTKPNLLVFLLD